MLINEGFVEQWRSVGATEAELSDVLVRDGATVSVENGDPKVMEWMRLVAMRQNPAKPPNSHSPASKPPAVSQPAAMPLPRSEWPFIVRIIARMRKPADVGIGDTLKTAFAAVGAETVTAALKAVGIDCGCSSRQAWFNARFPYASG